MAIGELTCIDDKTLDLRTTLLVDIIDVFGES